MKKQALFGCLLAATILLAGCEMPFVVSEKEVLEEYVDAQAEIVKSSLEIDEQLQLSLQATLKETEKKEFPAEQLINEVRSAKMTQKTLYQQMNGQKEPYGKENVKKLYLGVVQSHIDSYAQFEEILKKKDRKTFGTTLAQNQIKEDDVVAQSLVLLNHELQHYKLEPRDTLLPIEKSTEKSSEAN